jgi:DNA-directed RNA polymerase specialized sigma subunit
MMLDPNIEALDEFLELVKEAMPPKQKDELKTVQRRELDLWYTWNNGGRKPEHLKPLVESYKPLLQREANKFRSVEIPTSSLNAELRKQFVNAVKTYDPKKGTQLNTWVQHHIRKGSRFIKTYQNLGKIPEGQISKIREFKAAKEHLFNQNGFEADTQTLADHMKWPHKRVVQLQTELSRQDKSTSNYLHDPAEFLNPRELEAVHILQFDSRLSSEERTVYEYTFGMNGKPQLQPGQIASRTSIHPSKVSRIRTKLKKYLQEATDVL